ncbi:MAG: sugar phosphate isomerase/epimerase [Acidobacteriota bacterium]|nr:sugar phosphate isomerase/epimerase [Acidobacteriota bacterium]
MQLTRRAFGQGALAAAWMLASRRAWSLSSKFFRVGVISDEISQDFDHACFIAAREFGLQWVELRGLWSKSVLDLTEQEHAEAQRVLSRYGLQVTDIASPLFKVDWPYAPPTQHAKPGPRPAAEAVFAGQQQVLEKSIAAAKRFGTDKVRCFDFWRIEDQAPHRKAIDAKLAEAAATCGRSGVLLVLENEFECNTATGREAAATLAATPSPHLALNWDPANAVMLGEMDAFPGAWQLLPKHRIHHCHVKNAVVGPNGKVAWAPVGQGVLDWTAQFRALARVGYRGAVSLETHWHGGGTPEESSRQSWAGMKQTLVDSGCATA